MIKNILIWCIIASVGFSDFLRDDTNQIVLDTTTNLQWQDDSSASSVTKPWVTQSNYDDGNYTNTSGDTAFTYCEDLTLGGYDDWRVPNINELLSIVDKSRYNPAINEVFQNISSSNYWSSSTHVGSTYYAWYVYFYYGYSYYSYKYYSSYVRCVRGGQ